MKFKQGSIIASMEFPKETPEKFQKTVKGRRTVLVLHDDDMPNDTVVVSPLTSLHDDEGNEKELKSYHLPLYKKDYPELQNDSYVKLDQLMTFSRHKLGGRLICSLNEVDLASCHLKLIESLQMHDTIHELLQRQLKKLVQDTLEEYMKEQFKTNKGK